MNFWRQGTNYMVLTIVNDRHDIGSNNADMVMPQWRKSGDDAQVPTDAVAEACDTVDGWLMYSRKVTAMVLWEQEQA